jgi:biopolymer transport protein ExbB
MHAPFMTSLLLLNGQLPLLATMSDTWRAATSVFERGGAVMWPLLACSLLGLSVALERAIVFARFKARSRAGAPTVAALLDKLQQGRPDEALALGASEAAGPVGNLLADGLRTRSFGLSESLQVAANRLLDTLRRGFSVLDTIITLGPLLGILGTVTGIIRSFHLLSTAGIQDPTAVTGGIAEALLTTAAGLIVAIIALLPFNFFVAALRRHARDLEQTIHQCEVAYRQGEDRGATLPGEVSNAHAP